MLSNPKGDENVAPTFERISARRLRITQLARATAIVFVGASLLLATSRYLIIPFIIHAYPESATYLLNSGVFGAYPLQRYVSTDVTSPQANVLQSDPSCSDGLVLLSVGGQSVPGSGPMILDMVGNLVWSAPDQYGEASANTKIQHYQGQDYLTFWAGDKLQESGRGSYYLLNSSYDVAHTVSAVGVGLEGDLHEFDITAEGTALITVYERIWADLSATNIHLPEDQTIVDGILQEINIATGELLFEWRASDHLSHSALQTSHGALLADGSFDYFHMNSIQKDSKGHYLISLRHLHAVVYVDGRTGDIVWTLGKEAGDFEDLSEGEATSFQWQHDARWISEEEGIISLFDNGIARNHPDAEYSQGKIIWLDFDSWTATNIQDYRSFHLIGSASQGNVQSLQRSHGDDHIFIGWGASAAFSEFDIRGDLLCQVNFGASGLFYFERVKSYRAFKSFDWKGIPASWDPEARASGDKIYVSWNGATEVAYWSLQVLNISDIGRDNDTSFREVDLIAKGNGFESSLLLPNEDTSVYRVAALDAQQNFIRYSNEVSHPRNNLLLWIISAFIFSVVLLGSYYASCSYTGSQWFNRKQRLDTTEYHPLSQRQSA